MLDWMKKLFNKEEEQTAMNKEAMKQIESQPKIPRVNHYTEAREAQMASRNAGKCRFPLIPDDGFDEDDVRELPHFEEQPVQRGIYEEQPTQRGIKVERSRRQYVENAVSTYEEPEVQYEPDPEPVVKKVSVSPQESSRRPFRPTEMISPIYGYNRPSVEKKEEKQEEEKEREDLEISVEGKSVVDAWLEKKGYTLSYFSEGKAPTSSSHQDVDQQGQQSKKEEKSVVDQWLEKNGYEIERQEPVVEEKEVIQEINTPQEVSADELLHKTVAERMEDAEQEKDVVVLNENILQEELVDSKVEHEDTILSEEIKRNTEIEQPIMEVKKQAPEESVIVKAEGKLEETIIVEIPEEFGEVAEVMAEVEVMAEAEETEEAEVMAEAEETEEAEVMAEAEETEEAEVVVEAEETEEAEVMVEAEETEEAEVMAEMEETEEAEVIAETEGSEVEAIVELEETQQEMVLDEAIEQKNEFIHVAEADEQTKEDVQSFANVLIAETEESKLFVEEGPVAEEQPVAEEGPVAEEQPVVEEGPVAEEQPVVEEALVAEEQPVVEEALVAEEQPVVEEGPVAEEQPVVEEGPVAKEQPVVEEGPVVEEQPVAEEALVAEEQPVVKEGPVAKEQPIVQKEEPKREKKRHVPFNVVMLKQDRTRLMERHAARTSAMQSSMSERVENKPVHQLEEQPAQQMVVEPRVEEQPAQQMVVEPQVEEKPMQQVVVESRVEGTPVQQVVVEPQVEEKPMQQVVVEPQVEEKPIQQVVVEPQVEEKPMQQVVVEPQVEEQPVQQMVVESRVEERPVQQMVAGQVQKPSSSTEPQEKAYVVNQRENDMRNVLQTPPTYTVPPLALLSIPQQSALDNTEWLEEQKELLDTTFNNFHVGAHVINVSQGPAVTRFEVQPDPGVKVNKITNLSDDIKLSLAAKDIRIEAPIPGKSAIGIEVPNKESKPVFLREILRSPVFTKSESPLTVALGLDISGDPIVTDIRKMPHGLIAGATGSGKSVCINAILTSILYKAKPHEVKLILIDPKMVELAPYNSVPHLVAPVITDVKAATAALKWAVEEMERRYELFAHAGARDLTRYNTIVSEREIPGETLPYIVIVIDELADLMMVAPGDVEEAICRIAQKARACGIHLLVATQRPSVDVITGLIKSNIPTRIAFTVSSQVDSRTIIDIGGAEKLLGRGDMLFLGNGTSKPVRVQGVYVSDDEIEKTVDHVKKQMKPNYLFKQEDLLAKSEQSESEDELFLDACQFVVEQGGASTSSVQRKFRIGYNRAARLIEEMESQGIISEGRGTKPRDVLISEDEFAAMQETNI
ncbi:cell division protein FtsK [Bacillus thuringiensis serovar cameroun]|nr:cell division protein FtsK [Bacillus thuringiensis serovar cameroun]